MEFFLDIMETIDRENCSGFRHFGPEHIIWLLIFLCFAVCFCIIYRRLRSTGPLTLNPSMHRRTLRIAFADLMIVDVAIKYAIVIHNDVTVLSYLPVHLCSISLILVIIDGFMFDERKDASCKSNRAHRYIGNFLFLVGLPAGLSALLFPSWTILPAFGNLMSIHSFSIHFLFITYILMLLCSGDIKPDPRTIPVSVIALVLMTAGVYAYNLAFGTNFMYIMHISPGSPLAPFEALGDYRLGYVVMLAALILVLYGLPALVRGFLRRRS